MFKRIMVPIETKEKSEAAVKIAYGFATDYKSEVILFNVITPKSIEAMSGIGEDWDQGTEAENPSDEEREALTEIEREQRRKALEEDRYKMLYSIMKTGKGERMKIFIDIVEGDPATKISEMSRKNKVDLIIMPKAGKIGPRRVLVGDVAIKVAEMIDIPLMLIST